MGTPRAAAITALEGDAEVVEALGPDFAGALTPDDDGLPLAIAQARHAEARRLAVVAQTPVPRAGTDTWWRLTTSPRTGVPILIGVIAAMFATLFVVGDVLSRVLTAAWTAWVSPLVESGVSGVVGDGVLGRTVLWGRGRRHPGDDRGGHPVTSSRSTSCWRSSRTPGT